MSEFKGLKDYAKSVGIDLMVFASKRFEGVVPEENPFQSFRKKNSDSLGKKLRSTLRVLKRH